MAQTLLIHWTKQNEFGIPIIDEQHRGLVSTINSLHYFVQLGRSEDALGHTLSTLAHYTRLHFVTEELVLKEAAYPSLDSHVLLHQELTAKVIQMMREPPGQSDAKKALEFLHHWWINHIGAEDQKYVAHIKSHLGLKP